MAIKSMKPDRTTPLLGWLLSLIAWGFFFWLARFIRPVASGKTFLFSFSWAPSIGVDLSFYIDGLSLIFALLISGIGGLIFIYAGSYLSGKPLRGRFFLFLIAFMLSMLGLVMADNLILLFGFWELTSITSFFLIGFDHEKEESRSSAMQALIVTGAGGLCLLAGAILLAMVGGTPSLSELMTRGEMVRSHVLYLPILILILIGVATKSAQFPFHFWLPNAMAAPTPVSAYLHSATMVKAGVYLAARVNPILGSTPQWEYLVTGMGFVTMIIAAYLVFISSDLKRILAYSTVAALGLFMMLIGMGTAVALKAMILYLMAHAFYKAALFMIAGIIYHETGIRDAQGLGGLWRIMPITGIAALLALLSKSGIPPFVTFIGKEMVFGATLDSALSLLLTAGVFFVSVSFVVAAFLVGFGPFFKKMPDYGQKIHEVSFSFWIGPMVLSVLGIFWGIFNDRTGRWFVSPAASAIFGEEVNVHLALWHGVDIKLLLSGAAILLGILLYALWGRPFRRMIGWGEDRRWFGPEWGYGMLLDFIRMLSRWGGRILQNGLLHYYILFVIIGAIGIIGLPLLELNIKSLFLKGQSGTFYEIGLVIILLAGILQVVFSGSRIISIVGLGVVGYGMALLFLLFSAPDLAMTQFAIETLSVILLVLVILHIPRLTHHSSRLSRRVDAFFALSIGALITILVLMTAGLPEMGSVGSYFAENSYIKAHGRNVVNVILVDFRSFDTLGEITVLSVAAMGVYSLLRLRQEEKKR